MKLNSRKLFIFDLLIHITFLFIILFFFFQYVGLKEERNALKSSLKSESKRILLSNLQFREIKKKYQGMDDENKDKFFNLLVQNISEHTKLKKLHNSILIGLGYFILVLLLGISFYFSRNLVRQKKISKIGLTKYILNNLIVFSVICSIEIIFFFYFILKFQPITNSEIKKIFVQTYNQD